MNEVHRPPGLSPSVRRNPEEFVRFRRLTVTTDNNKIWDHFPAYHRNFFSKIEVLIA